MELWLDGWMNGEVSSEPSAQFEVAAPLTSLRERSAKFVSSRLFEWRIWLPIRPCDWLATLVGLPHTHGAPSRCSVALCGFGVTAVFTCWR
jgi:hypothetical protein